MKNFFQMNDWNIKTFLRFILAIQFAMWGSIGLDTFGLQIPILRPFIAFIYLIFIPGFIILRILKIHKLGNVETLLYVVGLSISSLMFIGLFMNSVFFYFNISRPISLMPLIIILSVYVLMLCILSYVRDKDFNKHTYIDTKQILYSPTLFLTTIPFLSIFGTFLFNFYHSNIIQIILIAIIALVVLLVGFDIFIPKNMYTLAIFIISVSLLLNTSLLSSYIWGWDIQIEYYTSNLVLSNFYWDTKIPSAVNGMLSIVMFSPIFSIISGIKLIWVFKIIYPLIFSLVPVGLYRVFQKQTNDKIAFFAAFFFMSINTFYIEMNALARQQTAEIFFVLLILLIIERNLEKSKRSFLLIVFGISLIVSHYAISYIFIGMLIMAYLLLLLSENHDIQKLINNLYSKFYMNKLNKFAFNPVQSKLAEKSISSIYLLLFVVFTLTWYINISSSSAFESIIYIGKHITTTIFSEFLNPESVQGLEVMGIKTSTPLQYIHMIMNYLNQIFIIIGVFVLLLFKDFKFEKEYTAFSVVDLTILFAAMSVPLFASSLNISRLYHITLFFLAPFTIIGIIKLFKILHKRLGNEWTDENTIKLIKLISIYFVMFFLYQIGFIYQIAGEKSNSISLNATMDYPLFNEQEIQGAKWLYGIKGTNIIYADDYRYLLLESFNLTQSNKFKPDFNLISKNSYIFLGTWNILKKEIIVRTKGGVIGAREYINSEDFINYRNKIYANGGTQIYS